MSHSGAILHITWLMSNELRQVLSLFVVFLWIVRTILLREKLENILNWVIFGCQNASLLGNLYLDFLLEENRNVNVEKIIYIRVKLWAIERLISDYWIHIEVFDVRGTTPLQLGQNDWPTSMAMMDTDKKRSRKQSIVRNPLLLLSLIMRSCQLIDFLLGTSLM